MRTLTLRALAVVLGASSAATTPPKKGHAPVVLAHRARTAEAKKPSKAHPQAPRSSPKHPSKASVPAKPPPPKKPTKASAPPRAKGDAAGAKTAPARRAHVQFGTHDLAPVPLVRGTLAGKPTWILIDTGASVHVVAGWAAKKAHLRTHRGGGVVQDHAGAEMDGRRADLASVRLEGWGALPSGPMLVLEQDADSLGARAGIGVVLSPQLLASKHQVVILDLAASELRIATEQEGARELATHPVELSKEASECGGIFAVPAAVDGRRASLVVDTGAASSDLSLGAPAAQKLAVRSKPSGRRHDAASGALAMRTVHGVQIRAGEHKTTVNLGLYAAEPDPVCPSDGDLGIDALKSCVLVFGGEPLVMRARCGG